MGLGTPTPRRMVQGNRVWAIGRHLESVDFGWGVDFRTLYLIGTQLNNANISQGLPKEIVNECKLLHHYWYLVSNAY